MKNKRIDGCGKQCLVDGELHLQCGDIEKGVIFLCHECMKTDNYLKIKNLKRGYRNGI